MKEAELKEIEAFYKKHAHTCCTLNVACGNIIRNDIPNLIQAIRDRGVAGSEIKDHQQGQIHNQLRDVAKKYAGAEQLRARLVAVVAPVFQAIRDRDEKIAELEEQAEKDLNTIHEMGEQCDMQE